MRGIQDNEIIIDGGYIETRELFREIKKEWKKKDPKARVIRVKTDTKGLIMYYVVKEVEEN
jgi:hypothetical protein